MGVKEKLVELIRCANYHPCRGSVKTIGSMFTTEFIEDIVSQLIANGVTVQELDSCKYCEEYADLPEHFINFKPVGRVFDTCIQMDESGRWHLEVPSGTDIGIKFCPMCGRKLPQSPKGE